MAVAFLVLSAAIMFIGSYFQPINSDEALVVVTDNVSSFARLIQVQRTVPMVVDPIVCHLLERISLICFGHNTFSLRLPSLLGCLVLQVCLFLFVYRAEGQRAAAAALGLFALGGTYMYAGEARPYGVLMGFFGLIAVSWQASTRSTAGRQRIRPLLLLAISVALALNTHYYAVLLLFPLYGVEIFRSIQKRHIDGPMQLALAGGVAGLVFVLPFIKGANQFRQDSLTQFVPNLHIITHAYLWLISGAMLTGLRNQRILAAGLLLLAASGYWLYRRRPHEGKAFAPQAETIFLLLVAGLPLFGFFVAWKEGIMLEGRYILCAGFGVDAILSIGLARFFYRRIAYAFLIVVLFTLALGFGLGQIALHVKERSRMNTFLVLPPQTQAALVTRPNQTVYLINSLVWIELEYYLPGQQPFSRLGVVYSFAQEMRADNTDYVSLEVSHLKAQSNFNIQTYEHIRAQPGEHLFVVSPRTWLDSALALDHASIQRLGPAYGGELVSVVFPASASGNSVAP
jgi:hypothetical protein